MIGRRRPQGVRWLLVAGAILPLLAPGGAAGQNIDARTVSLLQDLLSSTADLPPEVDRGALQAALADLRSAGVVGDRPVARPVTQGVPEAYAKALLLGTRAGEVPAEIAAVHNAAARGDRAAVERAVSDLFRKLGRTQPDSAQMRRYVDDVLAVRIEPEETARLTVQRPERSIEVADLKRAGAVAVEIVRTPPGGEPSRTVVTGEKTIVPTADGKAMETRATATAACTITEAQSRERGEKLNGEWRGGGETWTVSIAGQSLSATERRANGHTLVYAGTYRLGRLQATHLISAPADVVNLPDWVKQQLVGKASFVIRLDDCGLGRLEGTWESRHVTYSEDYQVIRRIHDPYDLALKLERRAMGWAALP